MGDSYYNHVLTIYRIFIPNPQNFHGKIIISLSFIAFRNFIYGKRGINFFKKNVDQAMNKIENILDQKIDIESNSKLFWDSFESINENLLPIRIIIEAALKDQIQLTQKLLQPPAEINPN